VLKAPIWYCQLSVCTKYLADLNMQLIGTNTVNGLAAAGQLSFSVVIVELVPNKLRGPFNALVLSTSVPFAVFGPPVARALYENTGLQWRWSYILGVIVNVIACVLYFLFYHPPTYGMLHVGGKSKMSQLKSLDWIGIALFVGGLAMFLIVSSITSLSCTVDTKPSLQTGS
jgi:hypothetical protein